MTASTARLVVATSQGRWELDVGERLLVGRAEDADIALEHPRLSRRHLRLEATPGGCRVEDLGSSQGTYVDGQRLDVVRMVAPPFQLSLGGEDGLRITVVSSARPERSEQPDGGELQLQQSLAHPGDAVLIGRDASCDITVDDLLVSRQHVRVTRGELGCVVEDLSSRNGTFVDGRRVEREVLSRDGVLSVGRHTFRLSGSMLQPDSHDGGVQFSAQSVNYTLPRGKVLLTDVSFVLPEASLLAVVGGSGAGKSTLLKAPSGEQPVTSGQVLYDGRDLYGHLASLRHCIGVVPQEDVVHPQLTAQEALEFAAELRFPDDLETDKRAVRVEEVMQELGLRPHAATRVAALSGGQRKRVSVALELLTKPSLIFLDEPTSGLDDDLVGEVMSTLRTMADAGHSVVLITHHTASLAVCDYVLILGVGGVTAYFGPPSGIETHFGTSDYAKIINATKVDAAGAAERFNKSELHRTHIATPLRRADSSPSTTSVEQVPQQSVKRQVSTLIRRQLRIMLADRGHLVFLGVMPFVLAILALVVPGEQGLAGPSGNATGTSQPTQILVVLILGAVFMGLSSSISLLVAERAIYRREHSVGLLPSAYLGAKIAVLTAVVCLQSLVMVVVTVSLRDGPDGAALIGVGSLELVLAVCLCSSACVPLGLWLSASVRTPDQIMPLLVVVVMLQLVLSGGLFPVDDRLLLEQLSWLSPSRWGFAAAASTIDATSIVPGLSDPLWTRGPFRWMGSLLGMVVLGALFLGLTHRRLTRPYTDVGRG